jgi:hypothetical protein
MDALGALVRSPTAFAACVAVFAMLPGLALASHQAHDWGLTFSVGVPHPLWLGVDWLASPKFTLELGAGGLSVPFKSADGSSVNLGISAIDLRGRWHPWAGAFFLGAALGFQRVHGTATEPIAYTQSGITQTVNVTADGTINAAYVTPQFGWMWVFSGGFTLGFDFGILVPISPRTQIDLVADSALGNTAIDIVRSTASYQELESRVDDVGNRVGKLNLPYVTVLKLGWMF